MPEQHHWNTKIMDATPNTVSLVVTSIVLKGSLSHVIYTPEGSELLLIGVPHKKCSLLEARQLSADIVRCLKFKYQTLSRCFGNKEHRPALERLFSSIWLQVSTSDSVTCPQFEHRFPAAHYMPLPRDAQIQIDDALSEFEANDFGSYTEDHHGSQRLYSIIGSCFFYKGYLLGSHLPSPDLVDVSAFCRQTALLSLTRQESLRRVVMWRQVYPLSCNRGLQTAVNTPLPIICPMDDGLCSLSVRE
ncbi:protein inturned-like [Nilaparvata lugens]|uniref:protein inturned-like n=1 Tax=Nilaparvata lugens TaxID=108931 RepID=UPI00193D8E4C|nr:protein inturned-like [Nilaparvata lugens]